MERRDQPANVRETFTEYDDNGTTVVRIHDPQNEHAWIVSTVSRLIRP